VTQTQKPEAAAKAQEPEAAAKAPSAFKRARAWIKARWWARWGLDAMLAIAVLVAITTWQNASLLGDGEPAPDFEMRALSGGAVQSLSDFKGKKTLVVFWAPWCGVCRTETGTISSIYDGGNGDYNVVSVALGYENIASVKQFVKDEGVDYPVLLGHAGVRDAYQIDKYPTMYILDAEGRVEDTLVGYTTGIGLRARLWL
jgi:peroxiredoxin